jgi:hypothetical protein
VPGFDALTIGRAHLFALGSNKVLRSDLVNEFHFSYMRNANEIGTPRGGLGVPVATQGFVTGAGTPGIVVQAPQFEGVENVAFQKFTIGVTTTGVTQANNTFHWNDNLSKVIGAHTLRVGGEFEYAQVNIDPNAQFNGTFSFSGTETGSDFADFLLGVPSGYIQAAGTPLFLRNKYGGAFGQDSWRIRQNLTLNYGLRWDFMEPWYDQYNQIQTFVPGQLCLSVSDPSQVAPGSATCGPFAENGVFVTKSGQVINGTRPFAPDFGSITAQRTIGRSRYNALELNLRYNGSQGAFSLATRTASRWIPHRISGSRSIRSIPT